MITTLTHDPRRPDPHTPDRAKELEQFVRILRAGLTDRVCFDAFHSQYALIRLRLALVQILSYCEAPDEQQRELRLLSVKYLLGAGLERPAAHGEKGGAPCSDAADAS